MKTLFWKVYKLDSSRGWRVHAKTEKMPDGMEEGIKDFSEAVPGTVLKTHEIRYGVNNSRRYEFSEESKINES